MKRITLIIFCLFNVILHAQKPETVYSIAKEQRETSWYEQQQKLWKQETVKNKLNANAWYNYYNATRALMNSFYEETDQEAAQKKRNAYREQSLEIIEQAYKAVPNSFEANHLKWRGSNFQPEYLRFLQKAYEIDPNDSRTYEDFMIENEISRKQAAFIQFCNKVYLSNTLPATLLNWGYNILSELDENAIVFTAGDNDTYATWVVQGAKNFRRDVKVINAFLILKDDYRNKLFAEMKLPALNVSLDKEDNQEKWEKGKKQIIEHILKNTAKIPVYVSVSAITQFEEDYSANLFLTGLAYKYQENSFDNISIIRRNYEKRYLMDYLKENFSFNMMNRHAENFDGMYLPSMLKLYKHYQESEEIFKMQELLKLIKVIGERSGRQSEVQEFLEESNANH